MLQDVIDAESKKYQQHTDFHNHDEGVEIRRFLDADDQNGGDGGNAEECDEIEDTRLVRQGSRVNSMRRQGSRDATQCFPAAVSTKMPLPIIAPMPSEIRLVAPKARLRLCSPVSLASFMIMPRGFFAKRLAIRCELRH